MVDPHTVRLLAENRTVTAEYILIATGGEPRRDLPIPGVEHAITSNEFFSLKRLPKRVLIVGGGYVAVEFASVFGGSQAPTPRSSTAATRSCAASTTRCGGP